MKKLRGRGRKCQTCDEWPDSSGFSQGTWFKRLRQEWWCLLWPNLGNLTVIFLYPIIYLFSCRRSLQRAVKTRRWGSLAILEAYYHYEPEVLLFVEVLTVSKNSFSLHKTYIVLCGSKDDFSSFLPLMWVYKVNLVLWITFLFLLKNCRVSNWKNDNLKM